MIGWIISEGKVWWLFPNQPHCMNCSGGHPSNHKGCPLYLYESVIHELWPMDGLSFLDAWRLFSVALTVITGTQTLTIQSLSNSSSLITLSHLRKCLCFFFQAFIVDLLQWNVDDFHVWLPNPQVVTQHHGPAVICLQETQLTLPCIKPSWLYSPPLWTSWQW